MKEEKENFPNLQENNLKKRIFKTLKKKIFLSHIKKKKITK